MRINRCPLKDIPLDLLFIWSIPNYVLNPIPDGYINCIVGRLGTHQTSRWPLAVVKGNYLGALTLRPPTFRPLMTTTQTLRHKNLTTQKHSDHMTLIPKSWRIVCPTKIVTLRLRKVGHTVTVELYNPLVFFVSIVCDITSLISPTSLAFSSWMLGSGCFVIIFALLKSSCVPRK